MWKKNRQHLSLIDQQQQTNKTSLGQSGLSNGQGSQSNVVNTVLSDLYDSYELDNKATDKPHTNESDLDDANFNVCNLLSVEIFFT